MNKEKILICGANGATGRILIELLIDHPKYEPIAMIRKPSQDQYFEDKGVKTIVADLTDDLNKVVKNIDKIIFAAGSKGKDVIGVDQDGAKGLTDAARASNVDKFVMLSTMGADDPSISEKLQDYLQAKQNADEYLKGSGLAYSIVRPGMLTNDEGTNKIKLAEKLGEFGGITRTDVARTLVLALDNDTKTNETFEIINDGIPIEKALKD